MKNLKRDLFSLLSLASNATEAYTACLFLENRRKDKFQLVSVHSLSPHIIVDASIETGQGFLGWVLENNEPLSVNQFDKDTITLGYYSRHENIKSFMATPLMSKKTRGALAIDSKKSWVFTNKTQKIITGFAQQFAYIVEEALLSAEKEKKMIDLFSFSDYLNTLRICRTEEQLFENICRVPREIIPSDSCFLVLVDGEAGRPYLANAFGFDELFLGKIKIHPYRSISGHVMKKNESLRLTDIRGAKGNQALFDPDEPSLDARSVIAIPLCDNDKTFGVLGFTGKRRNQFQSFLVKRSEIIGEIISDMIKKIQLEKNINTKKSFNTQANEEDEFNLRRHLEEILPERKKTGRQVSLLTISAKTGLDSDMEGDEIKSEDISQHLWSILSAFNKSGDILMKKDKNCLLLLLENSSQEYAETIVKRITKIINSSFCQAGENDHEVKAIVGTATFPHDAQGPDSLISASIRSYEHSEIELD
ncbi:MAG: GAF domain-containing protein [Nitrospinota bacterium]|nr:GAF domain-containing protein [Nitrospinota bacterium]